MACIRGPCCWEPQIPDSTCTVPPTVLALLSNQIWVWVNTYRYIFSGMNIHLPAILGFTRYQGFDPSPSINMPFFLTHFLVMLILSRKLAAGIHDCEADPAASVGVVSSLMA